MNWSYLLAQEFYDQVMRKINNKIKKLNNKI
jgi:hypothetical protein